MTPTRQPAAFRTRPARQAIRRARAHALRRAVAARRTRAAHAGARTTYCRSPTFRACYVLYADVLMCYIQPPLPITDRAASPGGDPPTYVHAWYGMAHVYCCRCFTRACCIHPVTDPGGNQTHVDAVYLHPPSPPWRARAAATLGASPILSPSPHPNLAITSAPTPIRSCCSARPCTRRRPRASSRLWRCCTMRVACSSCPACCCSDWPPFEHISRSADWRTFCGPIRRLPPPPTHSRG